MTRPRDEINVIFAFPEMSGALIRAGKCSEIPLIIINGELKFRGSIPSREDLRKAILSAL